MRTPSRGSGAGADTVYRGPERCSPLTHDRPEPERVDGRARPGRQRVHPARAISRPSSVPLAPLEVWTASTKTASHDN